MPGGRGRPKIRVMNGDGEPVATFYVHELDGKEGVCLGDGCPLCEIGDEPAFQALINVIDLSD